MFCFSWQETESCLCSLGCHFPLIEAWKRGWGFAATCEAPPAFESRSHTQTQHFWLTSWVQQGMGKGAIPWKEKIIWLPSGMADRSLGRTPCPLSMGPRIKVIKSFGKAAGESACCWTYSCPTAQSSQREISSNNETIKYWQMLTLVFPWKERLGMSRMYKRWLVYLGPWEANM